ncbi:hypothetical protein C2G38_2232245 [Gigaspora rosea]|uniref:Uncharacterized protein n=1 Tax=Gigaspora rosea TaxID=44941 RepID=A0A397TU83_9GLOM|nr:hypothetical protein C2G38_2232245 [Gigaspora rosea]
MNNCYRYRGSVAFKLLYESNNCRKEFIIEIGLKDPTFLRYFGVSKNKWNMLFRKHANQASITALLARDIKTPHCFAKKSHAVAQIDWRD